MTIDECVDQITEALNIDLSTDEVVRITNIIGDYTTDLSRALIRSSSLKVTEIIEQAIKETRK